MPKPSPGCDAVLVDHAQRAEAHVLRVVVVGEGEGVIAVEPAVVEVAAGSPAGLIMIMGFNDSATGKHQPHVGQCADALGRLPATARRSAAYPRRQPAGLAAQPKRIGRHRRRRADRLERSHAVLDHELELRQEAAMRIERRARIGAGGDAHPGLDGALEARDMCATTASDLRTMKSGMPAASPPAEMAAGAASVGTRNTPLRFMAAMISSVRKMPCSMVVMPASTASRDAVEPCACAAVSRPAFAGFLDGRAHLLERQLRRARLDPGRHHAARRDELDDVDARLELLPHRLAGVVGAVCFAPEQLPWPPVMHTGRPAARMRGPGKSPSAMARRAANST